MFDDLFEDRPKCVWCGSFGGFTNRLIIHMMAEDFSDLIAECEWCMYDKYFRKKAANGKGN